MNPLKHGLVISLASFFLGFPFVTMAYERGDPCEKASIGTASPSTKKVSRLRIKRDAAIDIVKHARRACCLLDTFAAANPDSQKYLKGRAVLMVGKLRAGILDPALSGISRSPGKAVWIETSGPTEASANKTRGKRKAPSRLS